MSTDSRKSLPYLLRKVEIGRILKETSTTGDERIKRWIRCRNEPQLPVLAVYTSKVEVKLRSFFLTGIVNSLQVFSLTTASILHVEWSVFRAWDIQSLKSCCRMIPQSTDTNFYFLPSRMFANFNFRKKRETFGFLTQQEFQIIRVISMSECDP
jgi:hypothetical protein